ncbi:putative Zn-dependent peptidase [Pontibacter ummariensis]|uniref:Predicted Zn-dependent peptidase n=1 Tax=Pontibacter ummariensis TaxID=1610492 RepID=A0A239CYJ2_9BACT|nr:pitrilysin family protein [Pontibacter ummariensis]PRY14779.1 putative Zn-dependent peptidase [Pontibacter ummariensis]SNS24624.1 Predicted Zn-dependent peptidase [Pontibacter ummariensis]
MIDFKEFTLDNGLRVIVHEDHTSPMAVLNVLYNVGSRDEEEAHTGFAHLFEHLMFSGSKNIPVYDEPLQRVGGENNAFTSPDITNYYLSLPAQNIETGFWLESDRMLELAFSENGLEVQRKVVVEEFKQNYLNQPYGDVWLKLRPLAYKEHPYKWATIGKDISHIEEATMDIVKAFFRKHYSPSNAILVVAGNVTFERAKELTEKWFGPIPAGERYERRIPQEPKQTEPRVLETSADVPLNAIYKAYHMPSRTHEDYYAVDLISDILGRGKSSRLYNRLVKEQKLFNSISASVSGSIEPGLLIIQGKLNEGVDLQEANAAIEAINQELIDQCVDEEELNKVKNQAETSIVFSEIELLNRAMNLAYSKLLGDTNLVNQEGEKVQVVTPEDVQRCAKQVLDPNNCSTLLYKAEKKKVAEPVAEEA